MKKLHTTVGILIGLILGVGFTVNAATILYPALGGTGIGSTVSGSVGKYLKVSDDSPFTYTFDTPSDISGTISTSSSETSGYFPTWASTNGTPALLAGTSALFQNGTKIGIGTTTPNRIFTVAGDGLYNQISFEDKSQAPGLRNATIGYNRGTFRINRLAATDASTTLMLIDPNGRVGIASTSPYAALSVNGKIAGTVLSIDGTILPSTFAGDVNIAGQTTLATSLTGILKGTAGVVSTASNGTDYTLLTAQTCGAGSFVSALTAIGGSTCTAGNTGTVTQIIAGLGLNGGIITTSGTISVATSSLYSGTIGQFPYFSGTNTITSTSSLFLATSNNVGIGTTTPDAKLHVISSTWPVGKFERTSSETNTGRYALEVMHSTTADMVDGFSSGMGFFARDSAGVDRSLAYIAGVRDGSDTEGSLHLMAGTSGAEDFLTIRSSGNVGIGTTSPYAQLSISNNATTPVNTPLFTIASTTAGTATSTLMTVLANGNVGIGTMSPAYKLDVAGGDIQIGNGQYLRAVRNTGAASIQVLGIESGTDTLVLKGGTSGGAVAMRFDDTGGTRMALYNGNVGIGTAIPTSKLNIAGAADNPSITASSGLFRIDASPITGLSIGIHSDAPYGAYIQSNNTPATSGGAFPLLLNPLGGNVGVGTTSPATAFDVNGTITQLTVKSCTLGLTTNALGSITGCVSSDESLKKNITSLDMSLETLIKLNPVTYQWKDTKTRDSQIHAGFIAQQVEIVLPQAVVSAGQGIKGVDPNAILAVVVNSIKEVERQIQGILSHQSEQDAKILKLEQEIQLLKQRINSN